MDKAYFEDANGRKGVAFLAVVATEEILQAVEQKNPTSKVLEAVKRIRALPQVNSETLKESRTFSAPLEKSQTEDVDLFHQQTSIVSLME